MHVAKQREYWPNPILMIGVIGSLVVLNVAAGVLGSIAWWANFVLLAGLVLLALRPWLQHTALPWRYVLSDLLVSAGILTLVLGVALLFEGYQLIWMWMLLISGGALAAQSIAVMRRQPSLAGRAWAQSLLWAGWIAVILALVFLAAHWGVLRFPLWLMESHWWGVVTILIGFGAYINAYQAARAAQEYQGAVRVLAYSGLVIMVLGVLSLVSPW